MSTGRIARTRARIKGTQVYIEPVTPRASSGLAYDAAAAGGRGYTWRAPNIGPNAALTWSHGNLVARSRDATRKNGLAESAVAAIESNAVGTGITPQWMTSDPGLNRELAQLWLDWTDESDADGRLDFYGQQALGVRATVEAGEVFGRLRVRRPEDMGDGIVPLQVQLLESEFCPIDRCELTEGGDVRNGIAFNLFGRRTAYWMHRQHPVDWLTLRGAADMTPVPVPAAEVFHVAPLRRPGQLRGEPALARALIKLRDLDKYDDAELMRKQTAALVAGFITEDADDDGAFGGESATDDDGAVSVTWEPATLQKLRRGQDIKFSEPTEVGGSYAAFMLEQKRSIAVSAGVLYEQLTGDYSQINDRLLRGALNEFRRRVQMWQHHIVVFQMCRPVVRRWIEIGQLAGLIRPPAGMEPRELMRVRWLPQRWAYLHPEQDVNAQIKEIRAGLTSRAATVSERGDSVEQIDEEQAADNARADELGLVYDSDGRKVSGAGLTQARPAGSVIPDPSPDDEDQEDADEADGRAGRGSGR